MLVAAWGGTKWSYSIETSHSEGPRRRDGTRAWAGRCCYLAKNWHPLQLLSRSLASDMAMGQ
jgi:hypothetical protein